MIQVHRRRIIGKIVGFTLIGEAIALPFWWLFSPEAAPEPPVSPFAVWEAPSIVPSVAPDSNRQYLRVRVP